MLLTRFNKKFCGFCEVLIGLSANIKTPPVSGGVFAFQLPVSMGGLDRSIQLYDA
jgi:hypothetical protein